MSYLHPRDFDTKQPIIEGLSIFRKFKSYIGLQGASKKLDQWLTDFKFLDIGTAIEQTDWAKAPKVQLGKYS